MTDNELMNTIEEWEGIAKEAVAAKIFPISKNSFLELCCFIHRQKEEIDRQDVEIMRLKHEIERLLARNTELNLLNKSATINARKELAERLKAMATNTFYDERKYVDTEDIDNLVKEMEGELKNETV